MSARVTFAGAGDAFGSGGRFNSCFVVDVPGFRYAIDFGATSLVALKQAGIDHNTIDAIVLTHIHADHCAGVPSMLMDAMLGAKRERPLIIAGPPDTEARLQGMMEALLPGSHIMTPRFPLTYVDMRLMRPHTLCEHLTVTPFPAYHTAETNPTSVRTEAGGKVVSYTGDSAWTQHMPAVARDADVFICECYFYQKPVRFHMNYPDVKAHWEDFGAKRIILTHLSPEMLAVADTLPEECAYDGLVVDM